MQVNASDLVKMLNKHIEKYGDGKVMIYDDYKSTYKSFSNDHISRMPGNRFVITCEMEESE